MNILDASKILSKSIRADARRLMRRSALAYRASVRSGEFWDAASHLRMAVQFREASKWWVYPAEDWPKWN